MPGLIESPELSTQKLATYTSMYMCMLLTFAIWPILSLIRLGNVIIMNINVILVRITYLVVLEPIWFHSGQESYPVEDMNQELLELSSLSKFGSKMTSEHSLACYSGEKVGGGGVNYICSQTFCFPNL